MEERLETKTAIITPWRLIFFHLDDNKPICIGKDESFQFTGDFSNKVTNKQNNNKTTKDFEYFFSLSTEMDLNTS